MGDWLNNYKCTCTEQTEHLEYPNFLSGEQCDKCKAYLEGTPRSQPCAPARRCEHCKTCKSPCNECQRKAGQRHNDFSPYGERPHSDCEVCSGTGTAVSAAIKKMKTMKTCDGCKGLSHIPKRKHSNQYIGALKESNGYWFAPNSRRRLVAQRLASASR